MSVTLEAIIIWNVIVFIIYGVDKGLAQRGAWRISEKTLFTTAALLGGIGAFFGMQLFRHKTKHTSFKIIIPLLAMLTAGVIVLLGGDLKWIR